MNTMVPTLYILFSALERLEYWQASNPAILGRMDCLRLTNRFHFSFHSPCLEDEPPGTMCVYRPQLLCCYHAFKTAVDLAPHHNHHHLRSYCGLCLPSHCDGWSASAVKLITNTIPTIPANQTSLPGRGKELLVGPSLPLPPKSSCTHKDWFIQQRCVSEVLRFSNEMKRTNLPLHPRR